MLQSADNLLQLTSFFMELDTLDNSSLLSAERHGTLATVRSEYLRRASIMQQLAEIAKRAYIQWRNKPKPSKKRRAQQQDRTISPKTRKVRNQ